MATAPVDRAARDRLARLVAVHEGKNDETISYIGTYVSLAFT